MNKGVGVFSCRTSKGRHRSRTHLSIAKTCPTPREVEGHGRIEPTPQVVDYTAAIDESAHDCAGAHLAKDRDRRHLGIRIPTKQTQKRHWIYDRQTRAGFANPF